jgi:hypothetical protein
MNIRAFKQCDRNEEPVAHAIARLAQAVFRLDTADAFTEMGTIEILALEVREGSERILQGISNVPSALEAIAAATRGQYE